jgi:hypothetical protein
MDTAFLHGTLFNLESKRYELEKQHYSRSEIINLFQKNYRNFSKKSAFTCVCCNKPVNMNLTKDNGRPFYFKHIESIDCVYSENSRNYESQNSIYEDVRKKDIGLTIFKEILEGQLKPLGIDVYRGFSFKRKLSFIPDFVLEIPNSNQIWVVDYFTAIAQGITTGSYVRKLKNRMDAYEQEGFKVFSFIDDSWLALDFETNKGTLLSSETVATRKDQEDIKWDRFLKNDLSLEEYKYLEEKIGKIIKIDTKSICYVNVDNRSCKIIRMLEFINNDRNISFYKLTDPTISLEQALSINNDMNQFTLFHTEEEKLRLDFKKKITISLTEAKKEKKEREELAQLELAQQKKLEEDKQKQSEKEYLEIEQQMQRIAREAKKRPIGKSPDQLDWYKKTGWYNKQKNANSYNETPKLINKKQLKFNEKMLTHPIKGENYINGKSVIWRTTVINWIVDQRVGDELKVSINKLMQYMKNNGITFNQKEKIVQYPIKEFFYIYQKEQKNELKSKLIITFID